MQQNYNLPPNKNPSLHTKQPLAFPTNKTPHSSSPSPPVPPQVKQLRMNGQQIIKAIQTYKWRGETALPIMRTTSYTVSPELSPKQQKLVFSSDPSNDNNRHKSPEQNTINSEIIQYVKEHPIVAFYELSIKIEKVRCRLSQIEILSLSQSVYLLKEMLIGFEVLVDLFGIFAPNDSMVAVNSHGHWKMWVNQDFSINIKHQSKISEKQFIYHLVMLCEKHCIATTQSKLFFNTLQQYSYSNDCSFIRILEKIKEFVTVNKVYQVNKVILPPKINCDPRGKIEGSERVASIKSNLKKLVVPNKTQSKQYTSGPLESQSAGITKNAYCSMKQFSSLTSPKSRTQFGNVKQSQFIPPNISKKFNTSTEIKQTLLQHQQSPKPQHIPSGWQQTSLEYAISLNQSLELIPQTSEAQRSTLPKFISSRANHPTNKSCIQTFPFFIPMVHKTSLSPTKKTTTAQISPTRHRQQIKHFNNQKNKMTPPPPQPQKKVYNRKYSEQIVSLKNIDFHVSRIQKNSGSIIFNKTPCSFSKQISPKDSGIHNTMIVLHCINPRPSNSGSSSLDVKAKSKHSTNPIHSIPNQEEMKHYKDSNYLKVPYQSRSKHNHSVINSPQMPTQNTPLSDSRKDKNMAVSYQFHDRAHHALDNIQKPQQKKDSTEQSKWKNKISGLFSDNVSIRQLKESFQYKTKEEEVFEKEYLKDIKLDLLEKFGRKVNQITDEEGQEYKSMQLIEEEMEEVKSYIEEDQKYEDVLAKANRSRNQTVQTHFSKQKINYEEHKEIMQEHYASEYDDDDKDSEGDSSNGGFNFKSENYSISPVKSIRQ